MKIRKHWILLTIILVGFVIRFYDLNKTPAALYWDEMDVGYQAYSFLNTGKDYFGNFLPLYFHSFFDFRTPLYIYATVPFVAILGLNSYSVRIVAVLAGVLGIFLIYLISKELFKERRVGLLTGLVFALSPWQIHYSRIGFEVTLMIVLLLIGVYGFIRGLKDSKWVYLSALGFGLTTWVYSTAKFFVPIFCLMLFLLFRKEIINQGYNKLKKPFMIFIFLLIPIMLGNFFSGGGTRFSHVSIFTDPTVAQEIDRRRLDAALFSGQEKKVGLSPSIFDKLFDNKPFFILGNFAQNYLGAISTNFLFLSGDSNLRHNSFNFGQFYIVEFLALILGTIFLVVKRGDFTKPGLFLLFWILLAPIPSALTRDGANHATRLILLQPAFAILIGLGISSLLNIKKYRFLFYSYLLVWFISSAILLRYYFVFYRVESAQAFQYGFQQAARLASQEKITYPKVVIDDDDSTALMAYLFENKVDPKDFQKATKNLDHELAPGIGAYKLDNVYFLHPMSRDWWKTIHAKVVKGKTLLILSEGQAREQDIDKLKDRLGNMGNLKDIIYYPSKVPSFYIIEFN